MTTQRSTAYFCVVVNFGNKRKSSRQGAFQYRSRQQSLCLYHVQSLEAVDPNRRMPTCTRVAGMRARVAG
ncbi:hypothetical protein KGP93_42150, partial [Burkholderia multivorans]|nr:hypothetical protein [Burkholderia multivorans]